MQTSCAIYVILDTITIKPVKQTEHELNVLVALLMLVFGEES